MKTKDIHARDAIFNGQSGSSADCWLTIRELAFLAGTTTEIISQMADMDLIVPGGKSESVMFSVEVIRTVKKILRLQRHLQISLDSMALIFELLERIDSLQQRIEKLEKES